MKLCLPTQVVLCMKLTIVLLMVAGMQVVSAKGYSQEKISISVKDAPLLKVLQEVSRQAGLRFWGNPEQLDASRHLTVDFREVYLKVVLDSCLKGTGLSYKITEEGYLIVNSQSNVRTTFPNDVKNVIDLSGFIFNDAGQPLEGASIVVKGTKYGIQTNSDGKFELKGIDPNAILLISYIGYEKVEISVSGRRMINLRLRKSSNELDQTIIKGYYLTTERLNTGDVTTVKSEDIQRQPVTDPLLALEGRVPGLYIQQNSGVPGAYSKILLMGKNSLLNGNDPLYIVDGVPFSSISLTNSQFGGGALGINSDFSKVPFNAAGNGLSPFNGLNPADIENIEILKDADATAIYGSRGANGVVLITTKKGKAGRTSLDVNVYSGYGKITRTLKLLNTDQYLKLRHAGIANDGKTVGATDYDLNGVWDTTRYTNWQDALLGNPAPFNNAQVGLSGGNENTQFLIGGGYSNQKTVYIGDFSDQKVSAHVSITHKAANDRLRVQFASNYVDDHSTLPSVDFANSITLAPDAPALYNLDGSLNWQMHNNTATWNNPAAIDMRKENAKATTFVNNLNVDYKLIRGLHIKGNLGYTRNQMSQQQTFPAVSYAPPNNTVPAARSLNIATTDFNSWIAEGQLGYDRHIGQGVLDFLLGTTFQQDLMNNMVILSKGFASDALITNPLAASSITFSNYGYSLYHYNGVYGRIGYVFRGRYLFNATARRDGSSRFGNGNQFGDFGAIGLGWIFTNESFAKSITSIVSFGKLRVSYGSTGNDEIADYQYLSAYSSNGNTNYQGLNGLYPTRLPNPNYGWEVVKKFQAGLDLGFLKDKVVFKINYYRNTDGNQLVGYPLPILTGFPSVQANLPAKVRNDGLEIYVTSSNISSRDFEWSSNFNFTLPRNTLISYPGISLSSYAYTYSVGHSIFSQFYYKYSGVNTQTGLYSFVTKNANGIPSTPADLYITKPITQKFYGGLQNSFSYRGFQLVFLFQFVKQTGLSVVRNFAPPGEVNNNEPTFVLDHWGAVGDKRPYQIATSGYNTQATKLYSSYLMSDGIITNSSFIRLKNLSISYNLPERLIHFAKIQSARLYIQGQNLLTITSYLGLDPETQGLALPPIKMITGGFQLTL